MPLNKVKASSNMYPFASATFNIIRGACPHACKYCYCRQWSSLWDNPPYLEEKELKTDLGRGRIIFCGSSIDMWADDIDPIWIRRVLCHCNEYHDNIYLFQSKNPIRFKDYVYDIPNNAILGTTLESNIWHPQMGNAPKPVTRMLGLAINGTRPRMISVEPVMDCDVDRFLGMIQEIHPHFVSIGADSKGHHLPEPSSEKLQALISGLEKFTKVYRKSNLRRLL